MPGRATVSAQQGMPAHRICLGRLGAPYGLKGWIRLISFTEHRETLLAHKTFYARPPKGERRDIPERELHMDAAREHGKGLIGHLRGFDTPEAVRELTGLELYVDAELLPELQDGEYYWHQLTGLQVSNTHGQVLGQVHSLLETGANDVLVVEPTAGSIDDTERLIPWVPDAVVQKVDLDAGTVLVEWEADYLL